MRLRTVWLVVVSAAISASVLAGCLIAPGQNESHLTYNLPTTLDVQVGEALAGTDIVYQGMSEDSAILLIDGQRATKRKGDSVSWDGTPVSGTSVELRLRIVWYTASDLRLAGTVKVVVNDVSPQRGTVQTTSPLKFTGPVGYGVARGAIIPGTTIMYEGATEEGAELGGLGEYAYRKTGDSILWEGQLRPGVYSRLEVRAVQFDDRGLRVAGLITLWLGD